MNVWDEEAGPLCSQDEAQRLIVLMQAGLTLREMEAYAALTGMESVN